MNCQEYMDDSDYWYPPYCEECQDSGKVPTMEHESYFGADYKPCPSCQGIYLSSDPLDNPFNLSD